MTTNMIHITCLLLTVAAIWCIVLASENVEVFEVKPPYKQRAITYNITVLTTASSSVCEKKFLGVTIDTSAVKNRWVGFNFSSNKLQNLAEALIPCDLRFGGTTADFLIFDSNAASDHVQLQREQAAEFADTFEDKKLRPQAQQNFTMSGKQWDELTTFVKKVGWDLIFDFNVFMRSYGVWDPSNADLLLNYSATKGVQLPFFQLGNEPDLYLRSFNVTITPSNLVSDFKILKSLISNYTMYKDSQLFGPGVTNLGVHSTSKTYLQQFIEAGGADVVNEIGIHHYYMNGATARLQDFLNTSILNSLKTVLDVAINLTSVVPHPVRIRLSETSSCYGGGAVSISNAYAAGFLWLDKLGIAAQYGLSRVFRQTFVGGSYELVSSSTFNPNPDFYLSVLFKRLVEGPVFPVTATPALGQLRVYANCARKDFFSYPPGALVLYYLNLGDEEAVLSLTQFASEDHEVFVLTPGDDHELLSRFVKLNGQILLMSGDDVPQMLPGHQRGDITVEGHSFGFIVIPQASVPACASYRASAAE